VHVGVVFSQADSGTDPAAIRQWAIDAEDAGFHHLLAYDHILGATPERLGPGPFGAFPSAPYTTEHTFHEILTLISHLAAATERLQFATSVLVLPQRQTALAAKQIATVDLLSGGRLNVAVGTGWNPAEYEGLGVDFTKAGAILREQVQVLRALWTQPSVDFNGSFHMLRGVGITPNPGVAKPIWMGTTITDAALRRVVAHADGWMPLVLKGIDPVSTRNGVIRLRQLAADAGRDPATLPVWGRTYLIDGWQRDVEEAIELGFTHLSIGFHRFAYPGRSHAEHLARSIDAKAEVDAMLGR
jgi:probable F420-dependent oxidoreductase